MVKSLFISINIHHRFYSSSSNLYIKNYIMTSDESDDEPLSVLAASKKQNPEKFQNYDKICETVKKKKRKTTPKKLPVALNISRKLSNLVTPTIVKRPLDVWMYLKDLKPAGPYSCLLCPEWFINRSKMLLHYILNHKKDYCGICRYFITEREAWWAHENFHSPWPCSQCIENFPSEAVLRQHLSSIHNLVYCRLCHFQVPDNEEYDIHLFQKHTVTNVSNKNEEVPWDLDYEGSPKFHCLFCSKSNILNAFFNHYMGYHHFTLKCIASIICGKNLPFQISGADISAEFVEKMKGHTQFGYIDMESKQDASEDTNDNGCDKDVVPKVKGETVSDNETKENEVIIDPEMKVQFELANSYEGVEDFDVTLMELIVFQKCYFLYLDLMLSDLKSNIIPMVSAIEYEKQMSFDLGLECSLCQNKFPMKQEFIMHMSKVHNVRSVPDYSCRVCVGTFDNHSELDIHIGEEMGDFEDLWLCQFCDKEFDNREATRRHLTEHWDLIDYENCFSPHLGFKCKYCPTLFWNETDRETHQLRVHFNNHKNNFYKCDICSDIFGDKVWFIYHYMEKHSNKETPETKYMFKCSLCCLVLNTVDEMRNHFFSNHPEARKIFCSLGSCSYKPLSHRKSFKLHLKTVHDPSRGRARAQGAARCGVCGRQFESSRACSTHAAQAHGEGRFNCSICQEHMNTMDERKLHYLIRHPGHHPFECRDCGKSFLYKSSLYIHRQEHVGDKKSFTCTICGKVFAKKDSYREHVQIHEGPRHACSYCPMRFVQRSNMLRHERRHTGERPYACPHCPRTFADKGACNSHAKTHIKGSSASYACVYCGQTFIQKSKLTYHIRKHTGENLERCTICSKLFTSMCSLREHMKTHDPYKNKVKCPLCDRKYKDERTMLRHLRTTHTSAQFSCPLCAKPLASPSGLRYHVITHSPLKTYRCNNCQKSAACKRTMIKHLRRRHNMKLAEINFKEHYDRLDPREAKLDLDEATLTSIFGPPKKKTGIIEDFVKIARVAAERGEESNGEEDIKESEKESEEESQSQSQCEDELEPTDFVSVKIEHIEENESNF